MFVLAAVAYRAVVDFDRDVRAGSELILELLRQPSPDDEDAAPHPRAAGIWSARFGDDRSVGVVDAGRSLAEARPPRTRGATVLAITRR